MRWLILGGLVVGALFAALTYPTTAKAQAVGPPTTQSCTSFTTTCSGATGVCTGNVPDAGTAEGVAIDNVRSYMVYACPPQGQVITAAGSYNNYHCHAASGRCPIIQGNTQSITTATTNLPSAAAGVGTSLLGCLEFQPFQVPYLDNTGDRGVWVPNGVTVSTTDGGSLTTYVCPAR